MTYWKKYRMVNLYEYHSSGNLSTEECICSYMAIAVIYALCSDRDEQLYTELWQFLLHQSPLMRRNLQRVYCDLDRYVVSSIRHSLPFVKIRTSWMNIIRFLSRKWRYLGLPAQINNLALKLSWVLPLLRPDQLDNAMVIIKEAAYRIERNYEFVVVFIRFLERCWMPIAETHSLAGSPDSRIDIIEAYNVQFSRRTGAYPTLLTFLNRLSVEIERSEQELVRFNAGIQNIFLPHDDQRTANLIHLLERNNNSITLEEFMTTVIDRNLEELILRTVDRELYFQDNTSNVAEPELLLLMDPIVGSLPRGQLTSSQVHLPSPPRIETEPIPGPSHVGISSSSRLLTDPAIGRISDNQSVSSQAHLPSSSPIATDPIPGPSNMSAASRLQSSYRGRVSRSSQYSSRSGSLSVASRSLDIRPPLPSTTISVPSVVRRTPPPLPPRFRSCEFTVRSSSSSLSEVSETRPSPSIQRSAGAHSSSISDVIRPLVTPLVTPLSSRSAHSRNRSSSATRFLGRRALPSSSSNVNVTAYIDLGDDSSRRRPPPRFPSESLGVRSSSSSSNRRESNSVLLIRETSSTPPRSTFEPVPGPSSAPDDSQYIVGIRPISHASSVNHSASIIIDEHRNVSGESSEAASTNEQEDGLITEDPTSSEGIIPEPRNGSSSEVAELQREVPEAGADNDIQQNRGDLIDAAEGGEAGEAIEAAEAGVIDDDGPLDVLENNNRPNWDDEFDSEDFEDIATMPDENVDRCSICFSNRPKVAYSQCGHQCICLKCQAVLQARYRPRNWNGFKCPLCRQYSLQLVVIQEV